MRKSKITALPPEMLEALNAKLVGSGFRDYDGLAKWVQAQGYDIARSTLHVYGSGLEAEFEEAMADARRTRALARAARETADADDGELMAVATEIMQDNLLRVSLKLKQNEGDPQDTARTLSLVSRAFADVGRFDITRQKWQAEIRAKAEAAAATVEKIARKGGLSSESVDALRREILGIAA